MTSVTVFSRCNQSPGLLDNRIPSSSFSLCFCKSSVRPTMVPSNMVKRHYKIPENDSGWKLVYTPGILHPLWSSAFTWSLGASKTRSAEAHAPNSGWASLVKRHPKSKTFPSALLSHSWGVQAVKFIQNTSKFKNIWNQKHLLSQLFCIRGSKLTQTIQKGHDMILRQYLTMNKLFT